MEQSKLTSFLDKTLEQADIDALTGLGKGAEATVIQGKVRDILDLGDELLILTSDRISAFDRVLTTIPCKGEVLNRIALFWFDQTGDIVPNHVVKQTSPRSVLVRKHELIPVEMVVRGYLTGSAWRDYQKGDPVSGIRLEEGLRYNERFASPLITPSTKAERGLHDEPISREEILRRGIVPEELWEKLERTALALFRRGSELVRKRGLILVDTKYEFGVADGEPVLVDEIHTPDSSRYWYADTYEELFARGESQRELDKEYFRRWLMDRGYSGDGTPPEITDQIRLEVAERYIRAFEEITGRRFVPSDLDPAREIETIRDAIERR